MPFYALFTGLILSVFSTGSTASDLSDMLQRMTQADQNQNYQGIFILRKSDELSSLRVTHGNDEKGIWETIEALNGEPRKVIRRNNKVVSIYPDRQLITIRHNKSDRSLHPRLPDNISQLDHFYAIEQMDNDRIANHQTLVINLKPKDKLRYGYRYWVDENTGMLLRCDLVDENQTVVEQMMFTSLDYLHETPQQPVTISQFEQYNQKVLDETAVIATGNSSATSAAGEEGVSAASQLPDAAAKSSAVSWQVNILPKGFMLTQSNLRHSSPSNAVNKQKPDLLHMVYSDGLASVSVFIEKKLDEQSHLRGASSMGAVNAFGHTVDGYAVTVVGEVPMKTVQSMAQSTARVHK